MEVEEVFAPWPEYPRAGAAARRRRHCEFLEAHGVGARLELARPLAGDGEALARFFPEGLRTVPVVTREEVACFAEYFKRTGAELRELLWLARCGASYALGLFPPGLLERHRELLRLYMGDEVESALAALLPGPSTVRARSVLAGMPRRFDEFVMRESAGAVFSPYCRTCHILARSGLGDEFMAALHADGDLAFNGDWNSLLEQALFKFMAAASYKVFRRVLNVARREYWNYSRLVNGLAEHKATNARIVKAAAQCNLRNYGAYLGILKRAGCADAYRSLCPQINTRGGFVRGVIERKLYDVARIMVAERADGWQTLLEFGVEEGLDWALERAEAVLAGPLGETYYYDAAQAPVLNGAVRAGRLDLAQRALDRINALVREELARPEPSFAARRIRDGSPLDPRCYCLRATGAARDRIIAWLDANGGRDALKSQLRSPYQVAPAADVRDLYRRGVPADDYRVYDLLRDKNFVAVEVLLQEGAVVDTKKVEHYLFEWFLDGPPSEVWSYYLSIEDWQAAYKGTRPSSLAATLCGGAVPAPAVSAAATGADPAPPVAAP